MQTNSSTYYTAFFYFMFKHGIVSGVSQGSVLGLLLINIIIIVTIGENKSNVLIFYWMRIIYFLLNIH